MTRLLVGYLTYLTEANKGYRFADFQASLRSLDRIASPQVELISVDDASIEAARASLASSSRFARRFEYEQNHLDVALLYTTMWDAIEIGAPYPAFLYDDFTVYDDALDDVITFLDTHPDVSCVRIPRYEHDAMSLFDADVTPKSVEPDAVRHYNCVTGAPLTWDGPFVVGEHHFYTNDWHYTSRPTVWRTDFFASVRLRGEYDALRRGTTATAGASASREP